METIVVPKSAVSRVWASVVLARPSQSSDRQKRQVPNQLSSCPARADVGQLDSSISSFHISRAGLHPADGQDEVKIPQDWANGLSRLRPGHPPGDVPLRRWHRLIDDIALFLGSGWAATAHVLGWTSGDLFGADRDRPYARIDLAGLLWLLNGNQLIALSENTAMIQTNTGARQTYRRQPQEPERVLAWEL